MEARKNGLPGLVRALALCLCLALAAGCAWAENIDVRQFCSDEGDYLSYRCRLPDGRLMFAGSKHPDKTKDTGRKWLLCLNPDGTKCWEYVAPAEEASTICYVTELPDGTIAALFDMGDEDHEPEGAPAKIRYYTRDGQATGQETDLPGRFMSQSEVTPEYIRVYDFESGVTTILDWYGNAVGNAAEAAGELGYRQAEVKDGILLYSQDAGENGRPRFRKKSEAGELLWDITLEPQWEDCDMAEIRQVLDTGDGGAAVLLIEGKTDGFGKEIWRNVLVKISGEGRLWVYKDDTDREGSEVFAGNDRLALYGGRLVLYSIPQWQQVSSVETPRIFRWFDLEGKELGTTELVLEAEDFPGAQPYLAPEDGRDPGYIWIYSLDMIPKEDGLWAAVDCEVRRAPEYGAGEECVAGSDSLVLVRIPEL